MVVRREKKSRKMHGYRNRGWGSVGQHRKSGSRGGRGAAGMHKHKWSWVLKYFRDWFGKRGFTSRPPHRKVTALVMNLRQLSELVDKMSSEGKLEVENGRLVIDLSKLGVNKLLGEGEISKPLKVVVEFASRRAREKIERAGGVVVRPSV